MKNLGILLNPKTNDLDIQVQRDAEGKIVQGFTVGDVTMQNAKTILYMQPGELKSHPTVGVGINNMLLDHESLLYKHKIRQQLTNDGMRVKKVELKIDGSQINGQNVEIHANYK